MAVLFGAFLVVGWLAGWFDGLASESPAQQVMVSSTLIVSLATGVLTEACVAARWFRPAKPGRFRSLLYVLFANWGSALVASALALVVLAIPALEAVRFLYVVVGLILAELVLVSAMAATFVSRRRRLLAAPSVPRCFGGFLVLNLLSMVVGVAAGRVYLNVFYPGVG